MECLELGNLRHHFEDIKAELDKKTVTKQILGGLKVVHDNAMIHYQIKPEVISLPAYYYNR